MLGQGRVMTGAEGCWWALYGQFRTVRIYRLPVRVEALSLVIIRKEVPNLNVRTMPSTRYLISSFRRASDDHWTSKRRGNCGTDYVLTFQLFGSR
jgi:hypothetical protein